MTNSDVLGIISLAFAAHCVLVYLLVRLIVTRGEPIMKPRNNEVTEVNWSLK